MVESLNSLLAQTHKNIEIIIVDDFSSDNSVIQIKSWISKNKSGLLIENKKNIGSTRTFNNALKKATGEYIIDFATDDILLPNFISAHLENFGKKSYQNIGISFSNVERINENGAHISFHFPLDNLGAAITKPPIGDLYQEILRKYFINSSGMMSKKIVYDKLAGYDTDLAYEDFDFLVRSARFFEIVYCDMVLSKKRISGNSMTTHFSKKNSPLGKNLRKSSFKVCEKAYHFNKNSQEHKSLFLRILLELKLSLKKHEVLLSIKYGILILKTLLKMLFIGKNIKG